MAVQRSFPTLAWSRALLLLALPGCLVSFNDYPLGDPEGVAADAGKSGSAAASGHAGVSAGGASTVPTSGASAGGSATAGDATAAGSPDSATGGTTSLVADPLIVDDFEDGNPAILEQQGRSGSWYVANDGRGTQTPRAGAPLVPSLLEPARDDSTHGAHTYGGPFLGWGALVGTAFASSGNNGVAYDVTTHQGVRFWARYGGQYPNPANQVRFSLRTPQTITGGGCTVCSDHFGADIPLSSQWVQVDVPFSTLKQNGYGRPALTAPDLKHALGIELSFPINVTFDLWIDDVEFY